MGFGDFAMGYLLGQSFSGPTYTGEIMGKPAGPDYDILNSDDPELVAVGEKAYWEAWDKACKEKVIERLRNPNDEFRLAPQTYPDISKEKWADLIESGEVRLLAPLKEPTGFGPLWANENREEAQKEAYKEMLKRAKQDIEEGKYRVII